MKQLPLGIKEKACGHARVRNIKERMGLNARVTLAAVVQAGSGDQKWCGHQLMRGPENRSIGELRSMQWWHRHWPRAGERGQLWQGRTHVRYLRQLPDIEGEEMSGCKRMQEGAISTYQCFSSSPNIY